VQRHSFDVSNGIAETDTRMINYKKLKMCHLSLEE
jgi:hypothetical protein